MGYVVFSVPETSTTLRTHGAVYPGRAPERHEITLSYEVELLKMQLHIEESITNVAILEAPILGQPGVPVVILLDRAGMDVKAYATSESTWHEILRRCNLTEEALIRRYDLVCHLVSAAHGAEEFYSLANNEARTEGMKDARELDNRTRINWSTHPFHHVIHNSPGFIAVCDSSNSLILTDGAVVTRPGNSRLYEDQKWSGTPTATSAANNMEGNSLEHQHAIL
eukprot:gene25448-30727_t